MREAVANETKFALLDILLDRVEEFFLGNLNVGYSRISTRSKEAFDGKSRLRSINRLWLTHLKLAIGPSWDFDDHVQNCLLLVCIEGNIVERRDDLAIFLNEDAVLQSVWSSDLTDSVF